MTSSTLCYLMAIYRLSQEQSEVRSIDIAAKLGVARTSVCKALDRLHENGYATRDDNNKVHLTARGRSVIELYSPALQAVSELLERELGLTHASAWSESLAMLGAVHTNTVRRICDRTRKEQA